MTMSTCERVDRVLLKWTGLEKEMKPPRVISSTRIADECSPNSILTAINNIVLLLGSHAQRLGVGNMG